LRLGGHGLDLEYLDCPSQPRNNLGEKQPEAQSGARSFDFDCVQWRPQVSTIRACLS